MKVFKRSSLSSSESMEHQALLSVSSDLMKKYQSLLILEQSLKSLLNQSRNSSLISRPATWKLILKVKQPQHLTMAQSKLLLETPGMKSLETVPRMCLLSTMPHGVVTARLLLLFGLNSVNTYKVWMMLLLQRWIALPTNTQASQLRATLPWFTTPRTTRVELLMKVDVNSLTSKVS